MIASWLSGVPTATQVSGSLARTTPEENAARNFAGMLSRFFASSECSKWPRNAKSLSVAPHVAMGEKDSDRSGGGGGAPPLRSSDSRHRTPPSPTSQHISPPSPSDTGQSLPVHPGFPLRRANHEAWGAVGGVPAPEGFLVQEWALNAILLAPIPFERGPARPLGSHAGDPAGARVEQRGHQ